MYLVKTPDRTYIKFQYLSIDEGKSLLKRSLYQPLSSNQLDFFKRNVYLLSNKKILYEIQSDQYYYLFDQESEYQKMLKGEKYYNTNIALDKTSLEIYSTFYLNPINGYEFFQKKVKQLKKYPLFDGYSTYLMPDGSIAYLRHRIEKLYDGYWYPSLKDFEHEYYFLTTNKYFPPQKTF